MFRRKYWKCIYILDPIGKEFLTTDKKGEEIRKTLSYRLQFIDGAKFMANSLSNLTSNFSEVIHKNKCTNCSKCSL